MLPPPTLSASMRAVLCPEYPGAPSATTAWNLRFLFASLKGRKLSKQQGGGFKLKALLISFSV